jgi:hypothetical protein
MLADEVDYVIGVDTHRDQHTLAVVSAPTGAPRRRCERAHVGTPMRCASRSGMRAASVSGPSRAPATTAPV